MKTPKIKNSDPLLLAFESVYTTSTNKDNWEVIQSDDEMWLQIKHKATELPWQGWKLHISASKHSAENVLSRTLPILLAGSTHFKIATSLKSLDFLNQGEGGFSQAGKFITIYPKDDQEAVQLASQLDATTRDLHGPKVPTDRPLRAGSIVHYRYGSFKNGLYIQSLNGIIQPAMRNQANELVPDVRQPQYKKPEWITDPFLAAGVAVELPEPSRLINKRYLLLTTITASVNHILYLAADLQASRSCVIKGSGYAWKDNLESQIHLRHEAEMLALLGPDPNVPEFYDLVEQDGELFLVMQDIDGETLDNWITKRRMVGPCQFTQALKWMIDISEILERIHTQKGVIYADVKSSNIMINPNGKVYLIDFEHAHKQSDQNAKSGGTPGYISPQVYRGLAATIQDDIYSCGALFYFIVTSAEPSLAPDPYHILHRSLEMLRPGIPPLIKSIIEQALQAEAKDRYSSMHEFKSALLDASKEMQEIPYGYPDIAIDKQKWLETSTHCRTIAKKLLHTLCTAAQPPAQGEGLVWESVSSTNKLIRRDLATGCSGVVLALAALTKEVGDEYTDTVLAQGATWLRSAPALNNQCLPGLYIGEAGVGTALLYSGQVLNDPNLIQAAGDIARQIASLPHVSPDLMNGTAGRLRFCLFMWHATGEKEYLQMALTCGTYLMQSACISDKQEVYWKIPNGYGNLSDKAYLGYAHGAAGIADALLDLWVATGHEYLLPVLQGVGKWLSRQAVSALASQNGLNWPIALEKTSLANPFWCHGATGIGRFFLNAANCDVIPGALAMATQAARTVIQAAKWMGPTQCHGLAGSIEFLLDMYQTTHDDNYYEEALAQARLLETFAKEEAGQYIFASETRHAFTPDYLLGYSGIATCFLRLSTPETMPHLLSCHGMLAGRQRDQKRGSTLTHIIQ